MTQDKLKRVVTACVSAGTVLLVCLLSFLIYQWIAIANLNKKILKAEADVAYWTEQCEITEGTAEYYESEFYLKWAIEELQLLKDKK
jgi:hypothetical protein